MEALLGSLTQVLRVQRSIAAMEYAVLAVAIIGLAATAAGTIGSDLGTTLSRLTGG